MKLEIKQFMINQYTKNLRDIGQESILIELDKSKKMIL